jgi:hypothetical protein
MTEEIRPYAPEVRQRRTFAAGWRQIFSRRNSGHVKKSTPNLAPTGGKVTRWNQLELAKRLGLSWER